MVKQTTRTIIVKGNPAEVFAAWADLESFPQFMPRLKSVTSTGGSSTHWVAEGPLGLEVEWDAETTLFEPGQRIGWHSRHGGDVRTSGQVTFTPLKNEQTEITVTLQYSAEGLKGLAGGMVADIDGMLDEALRAFKRHVEARVLAQL